MAEDDKDVILKDAEEDSGEEAEAGPSSLSTAEEEEATGSSLTSLILTLEEKSSPAEEANHTGQNGDKMESLKEKKKDNHMESAVLPGPPLNEKDPHVAPALKSAAQQPLKFISDIQPLPTPPQPPAVEQQPGAYAACHP